MTEVIPEKVQKITLSQIPLGRQGEPEDIANMVILNTCLCPLIDNFEGKISRV